MLRDCPNTIQNASRVVCYFFVTGGGSRRLPLRIEAINCTAIVQEFGGENGKFIDFVNDEQWAEMAVDKPEWVSHLNSFVVFCVPTA